MRVASARRIGVPDGSIQRVLQLAAQGVREYTVEEYDTDWDSDAYFTVSGQNANNSVRVPNAFFSALDAAATGTSPGGPTARSPRRCPPPSCGNEIADAAWDCADPGLQFDDTINEWHTCPDDGRINASNPCSEYMFLDDTACNLASLNLVKFLARGRLASTSRATGTPSGCGPSCSRSRS